MDTIGRLKARQEIVLIDVGSKLICNSLLENLCKHWDLGYWTIRGGVMKGCTTSLRYWFDAYFLPGNRKNALSKTSVEKLNKKRSKQINTIFQETSGYGITRGEFVGQLSDCINDSTYVKKFERR
jgi:hypothetical protein